MEQQIIHFGTDLTVLRPGNLLKAWSESVESSASTIILDLSDVIYIRPFAATLIISIASILKEKGKDVKWRKPRRSNASHQVAFLWRDAVKAARNQVQYRGPGIPLYKVNKRRSGVAKKIVDLINDQMPHMLPSVRRLAHLGFNECLDNISEHVKKYPFAAVSANALPTKHRIRICILDNGPGILATLKNNNKYKDLSTHLEAIELAVEKGVTGTSDSKRGMGLYLLDKFTRANGGRMVVLSGDAALFISPEGRISRRYRYGFTGTSVNLELRTDQDFFLNLEEELNEVESIF